MSNALHARLTDLYSAGELAQMQKVSRAMLEDPSIFDTHSREVRNLPASDKQQENSNGTS